MITIKDIAEAFETGLNDLADEVQFAIFPNAGEYAESVKVTRFQPKPQINGVLRPIISQVVPIQGLENYLFNVALEMVIPVQYVEVAQNIIYAYIKANAGSTGTLGGYGYVFNMLLPEISNQAIRPNAGDSVALTATLYYQFILDGKLSNQCTLTIDGETVLYTMCEVNRTRIPDTANIANDTEMKTKIFQQGLMIKCVLPYREKTKVIALASDIINPVVLTNNYTVAYSDGSVSASKTMVMTDGSIILEQGKVAGLNITFTTARV